MAEQITKERTSKESAPATSEVKANPEVTKKGEALKSELDALLDEIDEVLESDAQAFVASYVQKGGE